MALTPKRRRFAKYYATHGNATRAVIEAGYQVKNRAVARSMGYELLHVAEVRAELVRWEEFIDQQIPPSLATLEQLLDQSNDAGIRLAAAKELLERAGVRIIS